MDNVIAELIRSWGTFGLIIVFFGFMIWDKVKSAKDNKGVAEGKYKKDDMIYESLKDIKTSLTENIETINVALEKNVEAINEKINTLESNVDRKFSYLESTFNDKIVKHPAVFPEQLAEDCILSWSKENDLILDPFMGSGTTAKMAMINHRNFIGFELNEEYYKKMSKRIGNYDKNI